MRRLLIVAALFLVPVAGQAQTIEYYGLDAIGSVRVVFDANGNVLSRADYAPFGEPLFPATGKQQQVYAGLFAEGEAGFDYAEARMYQPRTGRFNTVDPVYAGLFQPQAWNRYAYALNSPALFVDRSGLNANECNVDICLEVRGSVYWSAWFSFWPIVPVNGGGGGWDVDFGGGGFWVPRTDNPGSDNPTPPLGPPGPTPPSPTPPGNPTSTQAARSKWQRLSSCFSDEFKFSFSAANLPALDIAELVTGIDVPQYIQDNRFARKTLGNVGATLGGLGGLVAEDAGLVTPMQAARAFLTKGGWYGAVLSPRGTLMAAGANVVVSAVLGTLVYEGGVVLGASAYGATQALLGNCR